MPDGGDFSLCLAYKSRKAEPFQSAAAFCQELKNNGFVGTGITNCYAIAVSGRITFTQIYGVFAPAEGQTVNGLGVMSDYEYWVTKDVNSLDFHDYVALISLAGTLVSGVTGVALINWRLNNLEKKVEKHNQIVERTYKLEGQVLELQHDVRDLKSGINELRGGQ